MPVGTVELVSLSEYARRRGCTEGAVRRAARDGRIALIDGKVDPVAADAQWQRNTRVRMGSRGTGNGARDDSAGADRATSDDSYWSAKSRREAAEAELAELKLAETRGDLVRAADVRTALAKRAAALRETLLQLPARLVPLLAAEPEPARMDRLLRDELVAALDQFTTPGAD